MPAPNKLKFVSPSAFRTMAAEKKDLTDIAILKSAPILDDLAKAVNKEARTIDFVISTAAVDRDNDTLDVSGWDIGNYVKNPVVLFAHDHWQPPVAQSLSVTQESGALRSKAFFTPKDLYPFGDMIFEFYAQGFMRATSVGFKPSEFKFNDDRKYGIDYLKQELLEYSCVPVPSNPEALMSAKSAGIDVSPLKAWAERLLDDQRMLKEAGGHTREVIERIRELTIDGKSLFVHLGDLKVPKAAEVPAEPKKEDAVSTTVKQLESWGCKTEGHVHRTKGEAETCELRETFVSNIVETVKAVKLYAGMTDIQEKVGRVLSSVNETRLRSAAVKGEEMAALVREVLAGLDKGDDEDDEDEEDDDKSTQPAETDEKFFVLDKAPGELDLDPAMVAAAMAEVLRAEVRAAVNAITGRVD